MQTTDLTETASSATATTIARTETSWQFRILDEAAGVDGVLTLGLDGDQVTSIDISDDLDLACEMAYEVMRTEEPSMQQRETGSQTMTNHEITYRKTETGYRVIVDATYSNTTEIGTVEKRTSREAVCAPGSRIASGYSVTERWHATGTNGKSATGYSGCRTRKEAAEMLVDAWVLAQRLAETPVVEAAEAQTQERRTLIDEAHADDLQGMDLSDVEEMERIASDDEPNCQADAEGNCTLHVVGDVCCAQTVEKAKVANATEAEWKQAIDATMKPGIPNLKQVDLRALATLIRGSGMCEVIEALQDICSMQQTLDISEMENRRMEGSIDYLRLAQSYLAQSDIDFADAADMLADFASAS